MLLEIVILVCLSMLAGATPPCMPPLPADTVAEAILEANSGVRMLLVVTAILLGAGVGLLVKVVTTRR